MNTLSKLGFLLTMKAQFTFIMTCYDKKKRFEHCIIWKVSCINTVSNGKLEIQDADVLLKNVGINDPDKLFTVLVSYTIVHKKGIFLSPSPPSPPPLSVLYV